MPDSSEVLIGLRDGDHVLLTNWRQGHEEWTYADADIRSGVWHGGLQVSFYSNDLSMFAEEFRRLYRELRGSAKINPTEPYLRLSLSGNGRGTFEVDGHAQSDLGTATYLCFHFEIDQTFLPKIADGLSAHIPPSRRIE